jgi:hypothetical protein
MDTTTLRLHRPWWTRAADPVAAAVQALFAVWQRWRERRIAQKAIDDALDLDEGTLRDMGAPLWLQDQARARREQRRFDGELERMRERLDSSRLY